MRFSIFFFLLSITAYPATFSQVWKAYQEARPISLAEINWDHSVGGVCVSKDGSQLGAFLSFFEMKDGKSGQHASSLPGMKSEYLSLTKTQVDETRALQEKYLSKIEELSVQEGEIGQFGNYVNLFRMAFHTGKAYYVRATFCNMGEELCKKLAGVKQWQPTEVCYYYKWY